MCDCVMTNAINGHANGSDVNGHADGRMNGYVNGTNGVSREHGTYEMKSHANGYVETTVELTGYYIITG